MPLIPEATRAVNAAIQERIESVDVAAYHIPTDQPESDGTLEWNSTTIVIVEIHSAGKVGLGYTYAHPAVAELLRDTLVPLLLKAPVAHAPALSAKALAAVRNLGRDGICAMALSAIDTALWDLRAKLLDVALVTLFGMTRERIPIYGSGGFTSYTIDTLQRQLSGWVASGIGMVKMKIGRDPNADLVRIAAARKAIGENAELFVDANGAYSHKEALRMAQTMTESRVSWFEEPVYHRDFDGLHLLQQHAPPSMEISAGEYGFEPKWFRDLLLRECVDVVQADATRCGGFSGFLSADALCDAWNMPLSSHCAPALHLHVACAAKRMRHIEYFHDHVAIEALLFEGVIEPKNGMLAPDITRPGHGLTLKRKDAQRYAC